MGDVLLTGPAVRAVAASGTGVTFLAGPAGAAAAALLPGVRAVLAWEAPWIAPEP
ncbi:MAG TPA: glycosyltransferase family 9 protein, partial [Streptosporangiaceae bacterium]